MTTKDSGRDFEHYGSVSNNYDKTRMPAGLEVITGLLYNHSVAHSKIPIGDIKLISLGCGTGNYEVELAKHLGRVYGIDISEGMLKMAQAKSNTLPARLSLDFLLSLTDAEPETKNLMPG